MKEKNRIVEGLEYAEMDLYTKDKHLIDVTKIDLEDVERVSQHRWYLSKDYAFCSQLKTSLHRFLLRAGGGLDVDHINHNTLDNRKNNLRLCTRSQNMMNMSNVKGVCWDKSRGKWMSHITIDYKTQFLGRFKYKQDAVNARNDAVKKHFKEFAFKEDEE